MRPNDLTTRVVGGPILSHRVPEGEACFSGRWPCPASHCQMSIRRSPPSQRRRRGLACSPFLRRRRRHSREAGRIVEYCRPGSLVHTRSTAFLLACSRAGVAGVLFLTSYVFVDIH
ncbi:hypothetical protein M441DRAFT_224697 [Trichoderma asperellum CBS 433.97]|uniref:Uncharacterized protein n=1 Tax=Trichoderma asperellum (strain ATCC 204424 / CBS 433.97 / NBRC 101777) TaxID=1042311 RepID=A0A2T3ZPR7_TRIA4|nr:hypothetical protein M441DRAFT_224697 [Trichoderma asperellum CBS 433.97]PTB46800.1 hypothetical protein M441DRAFT_224697 [Trichoderma asperellum CBS 433.97]